ncbi:hypothetical protein DFH11DRAFT_356034 [Phellopilus nigrolimitatus]|nr:hypothetical protein DFH11DRAFT_356034 [Phellopilus nigrolimitatus]
MPQAFRNLPPPPSPDSPWSAAVSNMTALYNYMQGYRKSQSFKMETKSSGEDHLPRWTSVCMIDGKEYGRFTDRSKKKANDEAAHQALKKLYNEDPSAIASSPSYLSKFKTYLAEHDLASRLEWTYEQDGEPHIPTWTCNISRDGVALATGVGASKRKAEEEAAKTAAQNWDRAS